MKFSIILGVLVLTVVGVHSKPKCPAKDGKNPVYVPHKDCTKFWQCSNGTPYLFDCPANLHFNPKLNVCDWPDQAGCNGSSGSGSSESSDWSSNSSSESSESSDSSSSSSSESSESSDSSSSSSSSSSESAED
jgi:nucleosome binding factor SPN SPT16 subunit